MHPIPGSQRSRVHSLLSSQLRESLPVHCPLTHMSCVVQALRSLQGTSRSVNLQPIAGSQKSAVHGLSSPHTIGDPGEHAPLVQTSFLVQALPSSQGSKLGRCTTTQRTGSHESSVQGFPSSVGRVRPPTHTPALHASSAVQQKPSSQGAKLSACAQPVEPLHESSVQGLPSSQLSSAPGRHTPPRHVS